jgi:L-ribulose-5-phosphate 4-epimerase
MTVAADVAGVVADLRLEVARLHAELPHWGLVVWTAGNVSARELVKVSV